MTSATRPITFNAEELTGLLDRQVALDRQLSLLAQEQGRLIAAGQTDLLLAILARRQTVITDLSQANQELQPFRTRWSELTTSFTAGQRDKVNALLEQIGALRAAIQQQDDRDCQQLTQSRNALGKELHHANHAGHAMNAYRVKGYQTANRYTDRKG